MLQVGLVVLATVAILMLGTLALFIYQGRRAPTGNPQYVALGSSFAAGIGLGKRDPGSPLICMRTVNSYPKQLARMRGLSLRDVTCSGATTKNVLHGGQVFLGPQVEALSTDTELVTLSIGGNDVRYVGDLSFLAGRRTTSLMGAALRHLWKGPLAPEQRDYARLRTDMIEAVGEIRRRAPSAQVVVVTYPTILPPTGTCSRIVVSEDEAIMMRAVGKRVAEVTRAVAAETGATLIDMETLGADHHACSAEPWVNGWIETQGTQFHPTLAGAEATARAISTALDAAKSQ